jgi:predicted secreted protein
MYLCGKITSSSFPTIGQHFNRGHFTVVHAHLPLHQRHMCSDAALMSGTEVSKMNPPINRENLRDALVALVIATGLVWGVTAFRGARLILRERLHLRPPNSFSSQPAPRNQTTQTHALLMPSNF